MSLQCYHCQQAIAENNLGRQDQCEHCGRDTRVCKNCKNYDPSYNNQCREDQAPRQVEKEKSNFCEWFQPRQGKLADADNKKDLHSAAESLFKKK